MIKKSILLLLLASTFYACDEQPLTLPEPAAPSEDTDKVVLVEELTGVKCPGCPAGALELENILNDLDANLAVVAIHGDFLTTPLSESQYDFRSPESSSIETLLQPFSKPAVAINRKTLTVNGQTHISNSAIDQWRQLIVDEIAIPSNIEISLAGSNESGVISVTAKVKALQDISESLSLSVGITQNNVVDPQLTNGSTIADYKHKHILRKMLTATLGDNIATSMSAGEEITKTFTFTIPSDPLWALGNFELVAFVANGEAPVLQAAKKKI